MANSMPNRGSTTNSSFEMLFVSPTQAAFFPAKLASGLYPFSAFSSVMSGRS
jgi:hypothetical protein